jgi:hypothetical protein
MINTGPSLNQTLSAEDYRRGTNNARIEILSQQRRRQQLPSFFLVSKTEPRMMTAVHREWCQGAGRRHGRACEREAHGEAASCATTVAS